MTGTIQDVDVYFYPSEIIKDKSLKAIKFGALMVSLLSSLACVTLAQNLIGSPWLKARPSWLNSGCVGLMMSV